MTMRTIAISLASASLAFSAVAASAHDDLTTVPAVANDYVPAKTAWGEPDFRGGWPIDHLNSRVPLERAEEHGSRVFLTEAEYAEKLDQVAALELRYQNEDTSDSMGIGHWAEMGGASRRTSYIVSPANGRLPAFTDEGKGLSEAMKSSWRFGQHFDWVTDFDSWDRCITRGLPASMFPFMYNNGMRVFQSPGLVAIQMEMVHETRLIYTDGRDPVPTNLRGWLGLSRGYWEDANTLVIETTNFEPGPSATNIGTTGSPRQNDTPVSAQARMIERLTMTGPDSIVYDVSWDDPVVFTAPWSARLDWQRDDDYQMFEYACHEGNVQVRNYITASRAQRAQEGKVAQ